MTAFEQACRNLIASRHRSFLKKKYRRSAKSTHFHPFGRHSTTAESLSSIWSLESLESLGSRYSRHRGSSLGGGGLPTRRYKLDKEQKALEVQLQKDEDVTDIFLLLHEGTMPTQSGLQPSFSRLGRKYIQHAICQVRNYTSIVPHAPRNCVGYQRKLSCGHTLLRSFISVDAHACVFPTASGRG